MIISNARADESVRPNDLLYNRDLAIRKMAVTMILNIAESNLDMVCDCDDDFKTKDAIERSFQHLNDVVLSTLEDHIYDLRTNIVRMLADLKVDARVRKMEYNEIGRLSDVDVELTFRHS